MADWKWFAFLFVVVYDTFIYTGIDSIVLNSLRVDQCALYFFKSGIFSSFIYCEAHFTEL